MKDDCQYIKSNLLFILNEIFAQPEVAKYFPQEMQSYDEQINQVQEYLIEAGECQIAYEIIVSMLESFPFQLSGSASIKLLETGLLMKFKTEKPEDSRFDKR